MIDAFDSYIRSHIALFTVLLAIILSFVLEPESYIFIILICFGISLVNLLYKKLELKNTQFYMEYDTTTVDIELNTLIRECLDEYKAFNLYEGIKHIDDDEENKMKQEMINLVSSRLSDTLIKKLSIKYRKSAIMNIIAVRITIIVMNDVIETNNAISTRSDDAAIKTGITSNEQTSLLTDMMKNMNM